MKSIDIIMVNYNSTQHAVESIRSIKNNIQSVQMNFIVVDNASTDNPQLIKSNFPEVTLIFNKINKGFSKAVNQAAKNCISPYMVLINPDTVFFDSSILQILNFFKENDDVGVIGPKILDTDGSLQGSARNFPSIWTSIFGRKSPLTRIFPNNPFTEREFPCFKNNNGDRPLEVDWVSGACMVIRRDIFDLVKGFDEAFFLYWEDTDICKRIKDTGYKIVYFPNAIITHAVGVSSNTKPIRSIIHFHYSCFKLFQKNVSISQISLIPIVLFGLSLRCFFVIVLKYISKTVISNRT